jgi:geranylgeranyl diphosphate synthase type II
VSFAATDTASAAATPDDVVPAVLAEYGERTRAALEEYLAPREPRRHLYDLVADYPRRGGRMLRPSLCIATARAFGAPADDAVRSAVALELFHNAFLVHDDVEDESTTRRGLPTLNASHGVAMAVNVGDALSLMALRALLDNRALLGTGLTMQVFEEAERMARETVEGQAMELGWRRDNVLQLEDADYFVMVLKKTCWYTTIYPLRVGALIGTRGRIDVERFLRFGFFLGAAFQIRDDLLNLEGDEVRYGKELSGDLLEGKRTLMLVHLLRSASATDRTRLGDFLARPRTERSAADVIWLRHAMDAAGSLEYARQVAHGLAGAARHEGEQLLGALHDSIDKRFVQALPTWVLSRT